MRTHSPSTMEARTKNPNVTLRVCIDVIILLLLATAGTLLYYKGKPFKIGYFCNDESIMLPAKEEIISTLTLLIIWLSVPISLIIVTEVRRRCRQSNFSEENENNFLGLRVTLMLQRMYKYIGTFLFGFFTCGFAYNYLGISTGRLRPSFLELCNPDFNCTESPFFYAENFTCTNKELDDEDDLRKSFPSGHSSMSTYSFLYSAFYLQNCLEITSSSMIKPIFQFLLLVLAAFIALSRIQDHRHHWDDVAGGFLLGLIVYFFTVYSQTDLFKNEAPVQKRSSKSPSSVQT